MRTINLLLFLGLGLSIGCSSVGTKVNRLSIGMTKSEVIDIMGDPNNTRADGTKEVLTYQNGALNSSFNQDTYQYLVVLENGKVSKYGQYSDFNIAQPKTQKIILDHNINNTSGR